MINNEIVFIQPPHLGELLLLLLLSTLDLPGDCVAVNDQEGLGERRRAGQYINMKRNCGLGKMINIPIHPEAGGEERKGEVPSNKFLEQLKALQHLFGDTHLNFKSNCGGSIIIQHFCCSFQQVFGAAQGFPASLP